MAGSFFYQTSAINDKFLYTIVNRLHKLNPVITENIQPIKVAQLKLNMILKNTNNWY